MDESTIRDVLNVERAETLARIHRHAIRISTQSSTSPQPNANSMMSRDPEGSTIAPYERAPLTLLSRLEPNSG